MITLNEVSLQRGVQPLLERASFTIHPGRRIGVIGPNGCGKSSLFQVLLGKLAFDAGEFSMPPRWRVAYMAQEVATSQRTALDYVIDGDQRLREVEAQIAATGDDHRLAELYGELDAMGAYQSTSRAEQLLHGLGFAQADIGQPVASFSGGWRIRLNLAQALMCPSDLLLLDEPTNHLDLDATFWLEQWLRTYPGTLLLISHDRDFLDNIVDEVLSVESRSLRSYRGNYSAFERQRAERLAQQQASYARQQERVAEIQQFVARFRAKATKARQAQSRLKELARMELIAPAHIDSPFDFCFSPAQKTSSPLLHLSDAELGYRGAPVLQKVNLNVQPGTRIGLLGPNGAGKSTLVKSLVGDLPLLAGDRVCGEHLAIGYFAQHQLEALDLAASALLHLQRLSPQATEQQIRNFLGGFNFHGDKAVEPIAPFSGGEKARLALALIVWQRPNLLLLDEPSNHLDLEMRHALELALQGYGGALVMITHDRHLLRNIVDEFLLVDEGRVEPFDGTLADYQALLRSRGSSPPLGSDGEGEPTARQDRKLQRQQAALQRRRQEPLKNRVRALERELDALQAELARVNEQLADASLYEASRKAQMQALLVEQGRLQRDIAQREERWLETHEALEALGG
jgi:ATP-binding cassette subfamily F protein 3